MKIPLGLSAYERPVAQEPAIRVLNRYFETDPTNQTDQVALLARMGLRRLLPLGEGPIRGYFSQPGAFDSASFAVSGDELFRVDTNGTVTRIAGGIFGNGMRSNVSMAATDEFLFVADGRILWVYTENSYAQGTLSGTAVNNDTIRIGAIYYRWTSGDVDAGTPDGSAGNPWLVALGATNTDALDNMREAIDGDGTPSETYSLSLEPHPDVRSVTSSATQLTVEAREAGTAGNAIVTTVIAGAGLAWGAGTLEDGGVPTFRQVPVPDDVGIISVGYIAGFVICVVAQGYGFNGRFYWIEPGFTTIDSLNFATAERAPDPVWNVLIFGDQFALPGTGTTEFWYPTTNEAIPFLRVQGRLFDQGTWEGTGVVIRNTLMLVDATGAVWKISDGLEKVSNPAIEERIRVAQLKQLQNL